MAWKVKITDAARQDIAGIKRWYKDQSVTALENFIDELTKAIDSLQENIIDFRPVYKDNRKLPLQKFPYAIFYQRKDAEQLVIINAVFHKQRGATIVDERLGYAE